MTESTKLYKQLCRMFPQLPSDGVTKVVLVCDITSAPKLYVQTLCNIRSVRSYRASKRRVVRV